MGREFKLGVLSSVYMDFDLITAFDHIADIGFQYVEIAAVDGALEHLRQEDLTSVNAVKIGQELRKRGLSAYSLAAHTPLDLEHSVERELPRLRFAAELGCSVCVGTCGSAGKQDTLKRNLDILVREAERLGVILALETNADAITHGKGGISFTSQWNSPYLGITYDAANVYRGMKGKIDIAEDFCMVVHDICHLHMKDLKREDGCWRFCPPGQGVVPTALILENLQKRKESIAVNLEIPYRYRFENLGAQLYQSQVAVEIEKIDRDLEEYLQMVKGYLKEKA